MRRVSSMAEPNPAALSAPVGVFIRSRELDHEPGWIEGVFSTLEAAKGTLDGWEQDGDQAVWRRTDPGRYEGHSIERWTVDEPSAAQGDGTGPDVPGAGP